ncbi:MAG: hypothetical protein KAX20_00495 [Candidatus Omnitrophica bacterium]|nr:hypothetical protein [Candidatus Omnitrophota bacterium]
MNHRERVLASLQHKEPDRIPIDLGGMDSTGIVGIAYNRLKKYLGIKGGRTQIFDPINPPLSRPLTIPPIGMKITQI